MRKLSTAVLMILAIFTASLYLPMLYEKIFSNRIEKTHLLYSPVTKRFIYKEKIVGPIPPEALGKAEDHHAETAYRDENGAWYTRVEFEKHLPFIYYKNMDLWGLLPLEIDGRKFTKAEIKKNRQVLELKPEEISGRSPETPLWPLLESNPGQARLVFPEDRFRMTGSAMEFVNADTNKVDPDLTARFTLALEKAGFVFPARSVGGKFSILKPLDEGVFIVDAGYKVFHVKRRDGDPVVVNTGIDPGLKTRHIKISENKRGEYYGLLLTRNGGLHLLSCDRYRMIQLPLRNYDPDTMDFKLLINPLYRTAVYSDDAVIRAVAMDGNFTPVDRYEHQMSRATTTAADKFRKVLFPFTLQLSRENSNYLQLVFRAGGPASLAGMFGSLALFSLYCLVRRRRLALPAAGIVFLTGVYGLVAVGFLAPEVGLDQGILIK
jgi:hypothetical protein